MGAILSDIMDNAEKINKSDFDLNIAKYKLVDRKFTYCVAPPIPNLMHNFRPKRRAGEARM